MRKDLRYILPLLLILLTGCHSRPQNAVKENQLPAIYPDYTGVTIPTDIAPLDFAMSDDEVTRIDVTVKGEKGGELHANGTYADFDIDEWHQLLQNNKGGKLLVQVFAEKDGQWTAYQEFPIYVSNEPLGEWGITYRRIPPSYQIYSKMGIYQRNLSNFDEEPLLVNTHIGGMCINCHTPNRTNPDQYVFHARGANGATIIHRKGKDELLQAKNEFLGGSMVYPYWHPGGRYCAFSTNVTSQMFHFAHQKRIEVYDSKSDVFVYDAESQTVLRDTLTMKLLWAENCPVFSPDGKWLYYLTAKRQLYPTDYDQERYNLCRVAFDEQTGRFGQQVDTLIHADQMGKSVTWPRPSYDGKYIMYTLADYGYFSIWHSEADLWLLDLQTGATQPINEVNSAESESFHNWTGNSRWFLFTSRRDDGLYSRIYLSSVVNGKATKPFMLPQRDPKHYYRDLLDSYNTPDFTKRKVDAHARRIAADIMSDRRIVTKVYLEKQNE